MVKGGVTVPRQNREGQVTIRHVPCTEERLAGSCAALPPRLGESPSAALVELKVDYPRFEFARTTVGAKWLMDGLHVSASVGDGGPVDHDVIGTHRHHPGS